VRGLRFGGSVQSRSAIFHNAASILAIARLDWRNLRRDRTLLLVALFSVLAAGYGLSNGMRLATAHSRLIDRLIREADNKLLETQNDLASGKISAPQPASLSYPVTEPPRPLAMLSIGESDLLPFNTTVSVYSTQHELFNHYELDNPLNLFAGHFDLAFVVVFLYPLVVFSLSFNLLSSEREQGTLGITLAQPVGLTHLVVGKAIPRVLFLLALGVVAPLVGVAITSPSLQNHGVAGGLFLWMTFVSAYICFWFSVAVVLNAFGRSSAVNAVRLVSIWMILVVVFPPVLGLIATSSHPLPSRLAYIAQLRAVDNETRTTSQSLVAKYYGDHPELTHGHDKDADDFPSRFYSMKHENQVRLLPEVERYEEQLRQQESLIARYRFCSPAILLQEILNSIAGTDGSRHAAFVKQARKYVEEWQAALVPFLFSRRPLNASDIAALPRFEFSDSPVEASGVAILWVGTILIFAIALSILRRVPFS
jgi:ABC-2 type transport system permease protein